MPRKHKKLRPETVGTAGRNQRQTLGARGVFTTYGPVTGQE
jgi:hypothetical protein